MKRNLALFIVLPFLVAVAGCSDTADRLVGPDPDHAPVTHSASGSGGAVTDPVGDGLDDQRTDPDPDLVSARVVCDGAFIHLEARVAPASFDPDSTVLSFNLDLDQDPSTGFPGVNAVNGDRDLMGTEYVVYLNYRMGQTLLIRFLSLPDEFELVGTYATTVLEDGLSVAIPTDDLEGVGGRMHYKVTGQHQLFGGTTGIVDYMPDLGHPPGTSSGCPIELELDLRPGGASPPINCRNPNKLIMFVLPGSARLDVAEVDHASVRLAGAAEWHVKRNTGEAIRHEGDSNEDGYGDLLFHFRLSDTDLDCTSTEAVLTGSLTDGTPFSATVPVTMNDPSRERVSP